MGGWGNRTHRPLSCEQDKPTGGISMIPSVEFLIEAEAYLQGGTYGLAEATWEPMTAFIRPNGSSNPTFCSYILENNERQLLTRA